MSVYILFTSGLGPHTALHIASFLGTVVFPLEQVRVEFSEPPVEIDAKELRVAAAEHILYKERRLRKHIGTAGAENIVDVQRNGCLPVLHEFITHARIHKIIGAYIALRGSSLAEHAAATIHSPPAATATATSTRRKNGARLVFTG